MQTWGGWGTLRGWGGWVGWAGGCACVLARCIVSIQRSALRLHKLFDINSLDETAWSSSLVSQTWNKQH